MSTQLQVFQDLVASLYNLTRSVPDPFFNLSCTLWRVYLLSSLYGMSVSSSSEAGREFNLYLLGLN